MQCLHCGKKLSLLRKLSDGRFCSDAHREEYERLEGDIALARLLGARGARSATQKDKGAGDRAAAPGAVLPMAPLLPESLRASAWRRVACPCLQLLAVRPVQSVPESGLRPAVRGFPQAVPADLDLPAGRRSPAPAAPHPAPSFEAAQEGGKAAGPSASSPPPGNGRQRSAAMAGLVALPLTPAGLAQPPASHPRPALMGRRKLVVIVPKPARRLRPAGLAPAGLLRLKAGPAAAPVPLAPEAVAWFGPAPHAGARALPRLVGGSLPLLKILPAGEAALGALPAPEEPPLCSRQEPVHGSRPLGGRPRAAFAGAALLSTESAPLIPSCVRPAAPAALPAAFRPAEHGAAPVNGEAPSRPALPDWKHAERALCAPASGLGLRRRDGGWPAAAGPLPAAAPAASGEPLSVRFLPDPLFASAGRRLLPERQHVHAPGGLRLAWRHAESRTAAAPARAPLPALARPQPDWDTLRATIPRSQLELIPPDPASGSGAACAQEIAAELPSLAALRAAVNAAEASPAAEMPPGGAARPGPAGRHGLPPSEPEEDTQAGIAAPPPARRVPEMPIRPAAQPRAALAPVSPSPAGACWASLDEPRPMIPRLRLELDHADGSGPRKRGESARKARPGRGSGASSRLAGRRFWSHAPSDLKWIAVVLPLLLVVVVYSFRAKTPNHPPEGGEMTATATAPAASAPQEGRLNALQRIILRRAAVRLFDDFRGGLGSWEGREGWAKTWRYGDATFIEPGELALLTPSLSMTDYTLTFLGQIERRSLNWVFRASDLANYYSMRIVITRGGPLPEAAVVRSVVINGREQEVRTLPIPFPVRADTLYLVRMEVRGQDFTTYIQNQVVDHFSDSRLKRGGVGFYSPKGDRALLRWVEVSHQYDYLGRLCALLSPYGVQNFASN